MTEQAYLDRQALAAYIGKCERTIVAWVKRGKLPPARQSGLWKREEVDCYLDGDTVNAPGSLIPHSPEAIRAATEKAALSR